MQGRNGSHDVESALFVSVISAIGALQRHHTLSYDTQGAGWNRTPDPTKIRWHGLQHCPGNRAMIAGNTSQVHGLFGAVKEDARGRWRRCRKRLGRVGVSTWLAMAHCMRTVRPSGVAVALGLAPMSRHFTTSRRLHLSPCNSMARRKDSSRPILS